MEVIYTGIRQTPEMIAETAMQEDVDLIGISILSGAHLELFPKIIAELKDRGIGDIPIIAGGIFPEEDQAELISLGVRAIFGPGTTTSEISAFIKKTLN